MKLTDSDKEDVKTMLDGRAWKLFSLYLQERRATHLSDLLVTPNSLLEFASREQTIGAANELSTVVEDFIQRHINTD